MDAIAAADGAGGVLAGLPERLQSLMAQRRAHPASTVVLVPYAQLMPLVRRLWAGHAPDGFAPRFETTQNWAARGGFAPGPTDLSFDRGLDLLTARAWLERAGLSSQAGLLAPRLVEAAWQLAGAAAAVAPPQRADWAERARGVSGLGLDHPVMALEAAIARIAIEWACASAYVTDTLLTQDTARSIDLLVVLQGLQPEPVADTLLAHLGERAVRWSLDAPAPPGRITLHPASDPADEAERAAACVMRHLEAGRHPVALAAVDRVLTRRIRAMLAARGVAIADETGWKLSTTRAAAQVVRLLEACAWDAASDQVLDWIKNTPAIAPRTAQALERRVRRAGLRTWSAVTPQRLDPAQGSAPPQGGISSQGGILSQAGADDASAPVAPPAWVGLIEQVNAWRERLQRTRSLPQWQEALREVLQAGRQWPALEADAAGAQVIAALGVDEAGQALWAQLPQGERRLSLQDFSTWVNDALEAASFVPDAPSSAQVVILPFNQLLARPFAALVVPGCDEVRLAPSPEPPGPWTAAQREVLGLPPREQLERTLRDGWRCAMQTAQVDVLWRSTDDTGEPVLASPLVQQLVLGGLAARGDEPRERRELPVRPVPRPLPSAPQLAVARLSASSYEDLRRCPYRFFALRQLGLQEASEIDADLDKRDFGNWLHEVLRRFHETEQAQGVVPEVRAQLLDRMAAEVTRALQMPPGEFLPFEAAWPQVRDGYLAALAKFESSQGTRFASAETEHEVTLGPVKLFGRIDRIDRLPDGSRMVMDYKTESASVTSARVKQPLEDTQLAFYAALLEDDSLRAAYVNVGERGETKFIEQPAVLEAREALAQGILEDLRRIGEGAPLPALGEGMVCEWCAARGLCRKDFWPGT